MKTLTDRQHSLSEIGLPTRVRTRTTDTVAYRFVDVVPSAPLRPQRLSLRPQGHHLADELFAGSSPFRRTDRFGPHTIPVGSSCAGPLGRYPGRPSSAGRLGRAVGKRGVEMQQGRLRSRPLGDEVLCAKGASASESDGGTPLSFRSTNQGREVFQPNAVAGLCHRRASLRARPRGPCLAECRSSRAPPPCSSRPFLPISALFMTTRIASMAYLSSLTGMRRPSRTPATPSG
jgi:hypothetical protein